MILKFDVTSLVYMEQLYIQVKVGSVLHESIPSIQVFQASPRLL
jgi:hypothetical protein